MAQHGANAPVVLGEFAGVYGVKGWLRIRSYTQPIDNILDYATWLIGGGADWKETELAEGRPTATG